MSTLPEIAETPLPDLMSEADVDEWVARVRAAERYRPPERDPLFEVLAPAYPRIAERIHDIWGSAECDEYLNRLIIDDRGGRGGFPAEVLAALLKLSEKHQRAYRRTTTMSWRGLSDRVRGAGGTSAT